jgi:hypothetical protein
MKIYNKIMISSIYTAQNNGFMSDMWKFMSTISFAYCSAMIIMFLYNIVNNYIIKNSLDFILINIVSNKPYNFVLNIVIYIFLPITLINYYSFFKKNKYKTLMKENKNYQSKKIFVIYFIIAHICLITTLFLKP